MKNGKLNFLDDREKLKVIENLDVFDLEEKMIKISELIEMKDEKQINNWEKQYRD